MCVLNNFCFLVFITGLAPGARGPMGMGMMGQGGSGGADYSSFMGGHPEPFDYERAMEQRFGAASQVTHVTGTAQLTVYG